jgi:hypothetical protein
MRAEFCTKKMVNICYGVNFTDKANIKEKKIEKIK